MNSLLIILALIIFTGIYILIPDIGPTAVLGCLFLTAISVLVIRKSQHKNFLIRMFVGALLIRLLVGTMIYAFNLQEFFGGDALTYDQFGMLTLRFWQGKDQHLRSFLNFYYVGSGWGMLYLVAIVYGVVGRNPLLIQFISAIAGAATVPAVFLCALRIFQNIKVARLTAFFAAFYPSLILWSSQGLKDGLIVFLLTIVMLMTLRLGERLSIKNLVVLGFALLCLLSLRFYVFYMVVAAIGGSLIIGMRSTTVNSMIRQFLTVIVIGLFLTYFGVLRTATTQFETFGSLERVQNSRKDLAVRANSSFGKDVDVSTTTGALTAIPLGMVYLLFAPFPWQFANLRQSLTLPEMLVWWAAFPFLMLGLWFTIKYRLRQALPILIFSSMLTLSYSIFQGNVGTAYRQRSQVMIFYFIFASVGFVLLQEVRAVKRQAAVAEKEEHVAKQAAIRAARTTAVTRSAWHGRGERAAYEEESRLAAAPVVEETEGGQTDKR